MPKGGRLGVVEEETSSNLSGEVEEIKMKMAEMGQQNLQMGENIKQMQIQMQENNAQMQNQMEILMKTVLAKAGPNEQQAAAATTTTQDCSGSQMGMNYGGSPGSAEPFRGTPGSGYSSVLPTMCLGMSEYPILPATNTHSAAIPHFSFPSTIVNTSLPPLVPSVGGVTQFSPGGYVAPQYINTTSNMFPSPGYAHCPYPGYSLGRPEQHWARPEYGNGFQPPWLANQNRNQNGQSFTGPKLEFPKFDGMNPEAWIRKFERCFELSRIPPEQKVSMAEVHLTGRADQWITSNNVDTNSLTWPQFCNLICKRFAADNKIDIADTFRGLQQTGTVDNYIDKFEEVMALVKRNNATLREGYFLDFFLSGLKDYIKIPLKSLDPKNLVEAYVHARNYENMPLYKKPIWSGGGNSKGSYSSSHSTKGNHVVNTKENYTKGGKSVASGADKWNGGKCFKCQEPWVPGHSSVCKFKKSFHLITIEDNEEEEESPLFSTPPSSPEHKEDEKTDLQISMHAICGTSTTASTFTLNVKMGNVSAVALVDTGSTATFITPMLAVKANCKLMNHEPVKVSVANGGVIVSEALSQDCSYKIQGEVFNSDFRVLSLKGYDMILGSDWIYSHSPVSLNLKTREFSICKNGERIVSFKDETWPRENCIVNVHKLQKLLCKGVAGALVSAKLAPSLQERPEHVPEEILKKAPTL